MIFTIGEISPDLTALWWAGLVVFFIVAAFIVGFWLESEGILVPTSIVAGLSVIIGLPLVFVGIIPDTIDIRTEQAKVQGMENLGFASVDLAEDETFIARKGNDYYRGTLLELGERTYQVVELKEIK